MINFKQRELANALFDAIKMKFPEIELINISESPADAEDIWVNLTAPEDEDREIELIEFAGDITTDILLNYGYYISIMTRGPSSELRQNSPVGTENKIEQFSV